jgi:hypothetical protein
MLYLFKLQLISARQISLMIPNLIIHHISYMALKIYYKLNLNNNLRGISY